MSNIQEDPCPKCGLEFWRYAQECGRCGTTRWTLMLEFIARDPFTGKEHS